MHPEGLQCHPLLLGYIYSCPKRRCHRQSDKPRLMAQQFYHQMCLNIGLRSLVDLILSDLPSITQKVCWQSWELKPALLKPSSQGHPSSHAPLIDLAEGHPSCMIKYPPPLYCRLSVESSIRDTWCCVTAKYCQVTWVLYFTEMNFLCAGINLEKGGLKSIFS